MVLPYCYSDGEVTNDPKKEKEKKKGLFIITPSPPKKYTRILISNYFHTRSITHVRTHGWVWGVGDPRGVYSTFCINEFTQTGNCHPERNNQTKKGGGNAMSQKGVEKDK